MKTFDDQIMRCTQERNRSLGAKLAEETLNMLNMYREGRLILLIHEPAKSSITKLRQLHCLNLPTNTSDGITLRVL